MWRLKRRAWGITAGGLVSMFLWFCLPALTEVNYETLKSGVVKIITPKETGAGIVVGVDGSAALIVTALHVVADAQSIQVVFPDKPYLQFSGRRFVKNAEALDLAVVIVDPQGGKPIPQGLPHFSLGNVVTRETVSAIGHPEGNDWQMALGINKIVSLNDTDDSRLFRFTSITIDRGNSGGPVFDDQGRLIGMVTRVLPGDIAQAVKITEVVTLLHEWGIKSTLLVSSEKVPPSPPEEAQPPSEPGMVYVPAGEFFMGCNEEIDQQCFNAEKPGRRVNLPAFSIDKTEVTVADYQRCVEEKACTLPSNRDYYCGWEGWKEEERENPVYCVDWNQATVYCKWAGKRLPSEAEWEKAARGTDGRIYPWGNNWDGKKANVDSRGTVPVGSYPLGVSPYGVYDMAGNVEEWTADWYDAKRQSRSLRGGSRNDPPVSARASARYGGGPGYRRDYVGFRCAQ